MKNKNYLKTVISLMVFLVMIISSTMIPSPVSAATIAVTTFDDVDDPALCSLRDAIKSANEARAYNLCESGSTSADIISLPAGIYTLDGSSLPSITSTITIRGSGSSDTIIQASACNPTEKSCAHDHRIFYVDVVPNVGTGNLTLTHVTLRHGNLRGSVDGGAVYNKGVLTLMNSTISANIANHGGGIYSQSYFLESINVKNSIFTENHANDSGGGLYIEWADLPILNSTIEANSAGNHGGGIYITSNARVDITDSIILKNTAFHHGGGIYSNTDYSPPLEASTIVNSHIEGNTAEWGGGIYNTGQMDLDSCTLELNAADNSGGGIYNLFGGIMEIHKSTLRKNDAIQGDGGGILNNGVLSSFNSTFSQNNTSLSGGGIFNNFNLNLINCTLFENTAQNLGGGIYNTSTGELNYQNTIIAGSSSYDCYNSGGFTVSNHNLVENSPPSSGNQCGSIYMDDDPRLSPLGDHGGPTQTHALLRDSPAIDAGDTSPSVCLDTDQRGVDRPQGEGCDIGAFELEQGFTIFLPLILR